jgi:hypothetical protein
LPSFECTPCPNWNRHASASYSCASSIPYSSISSSSAKSVYPSKTIYN